jgi:glycosyltransferase involved in cell wall biosynthesis
VKLSVLVPVYNEERTLAEVVRRVCAFPMAKEIILVDDGSKYKSR